MINPARSKQQAYENAAFALTHVSSLVTVDPLLLPEITCVYEAPTPHSPIAVVYAFSK